MCGGIFGWVSSLIKSLNRTIATWHQQRNVISHAICISKS